MAEVEPPEGISTRKLVLETGKFNVLTAYSQEEVLEALQKFPAVEAVVLHISLCPGTCEQIINRLKKLVPHIKVIVLAPQPGGNLRSADHEISSHEPQELLTLARSLFGDPRPLASTGRT